MNGLCAEKTNESTTKPNWLELPIDLTMNILQRLDAVEIVTSARNICPLWWNICKDPQMLRTIRMTGDFSTIYRFNFSRSGMEKLCRSAIDFSCGHLEEIAISWFGTDELLNYIAHRGSHLRRLQLFGCNGISDKGLSEFVKRFSLLEELVICRGNQSLSKDSIEIIGQCCPLLKSLNLARLLCTQTLNGWFVYSYGDGDEAFAIAKTMYGLRHLKLKGFLLNYDGLLAILDDCPLLESLDLQYSLYHSSISNPSLQKRCRMQIKYFQPPNHFT